MVQQLTETVAKRLPDLTNKDELKLFLLEHDHLNSKGAFRNRFTPAAAKRLVLKHESDGEKRKEIMTLLEQFKKQKYGADRSE